jgi:hypothetical protein
LEEHKLKLLSFLSMLLYMHSGVCFYFWICLTLDFSSVYLSFVFSS